MTEAVEVTGKFRRMRLRKISWTGQNKEVRSLTPISAAGNGCMNELKNVFALVINLISDEKYEETG